MAITSSTFDPLKTYIAVRLQQGVPIVDADENEREDIHRFEVRAFLKWFVGNGIPEGNDGFRIVPSSTSANNFRISKGITLPAGITLNPIEEGLNYVGRCLVDGLDVLIRNDLDFTAQRLHEDHPDSTAEQTKLGVPKIARLPNANTTIVVYLDVWERDVDHNEDSSLVLTGLGVPSCARLKREWVVRVRTPGSTFLVPQPTDPDYIAKHSYYALATIARRAGVPSVTAADITDLREQKLLMLPSTLMTDLLDVSPTDYRRGQGRPAISLREAINALMRGELPSTPDAAIAPDPGDDEPSRAFLFDSTNGLVAVWYSDRSGGTFQIWSARLDLGNIRSGFTSLQQITTGAVSHIDPSAVLLPNGELAIVYQAGDGPASDIVFKRAFLGNLNAAPEQPVANTAAVAERSPFVIVSRDWIVFFYHLGSTNNWQYRRYRHTNNTWEDATPRVLSSIAATVRDFHAARDQNDNIWVAFTASTDVQALRLTPATSAIPPATITTISAGANPDDQPFVLPVASGNAWVFWREATTGLYWRRFRADTNTWEAVQLITNTIAGDSHPSAVEDVDGGIWLFWTRGTGLTSDIFFMRYNPIVNAWGQPRQMTFTPRSDSRPSVLRAADKAFWIFWLSDRDLNFDLYYKRLITAL